MSRISTKAMSTEAEDRGALMPAEGACKRCRRSVGSFHNHFFKLAGTSYFLPVLPGSVDSKLSLVTNRAPKTAAPGSQLDGCTTQQLACPHCRDNLGCRVADVPPDKQAFRGRDLFKLSRINLNCALESDDEGFTALPYDDQSFDPFAEESSDSIDANPVDTPEESGQSEEPESFQTEDSDSELSEPPDDSDDQDAMEVDTRHSLPRHEPQFREPHRHQSVQQVETSRHSLPPPQRSPGAAPVAMHAPAQKPPSNSHPSQSPAVRPVHDPQFARPPSRESTAGLASRPRDPPPVPNSPVDHHRPNGQYHPRPTNEVSMDAHARLQAQVSQNSSTLSHHQEELARYWGAIIDQRAQLDHQGNEIRRLEYNITNIDHARQGLHHEMQNIRESLAALHRDPRLQAAQGSGAAIPDRDKALELMAQQLQAASQKANKVDELEINLELLKGEIRKLKEGAVAAPLPVAPPQPSYHNPPQPYQPTPQQVYQATSGPLPQVDPAVRPIQRNASFPSQISLPVQEPERHEPVPVQAGWATVNAGVKRVIEAPPQEPNGYQMSSPKRTKLAPIESRATYADSQIHPQQVYDHMQAHPHTLPSQPQPQPHESQAESSRPQPTLASHNLPKNFSLNALQQSLEAMPKSQSYVAQDRSPPDSQRMLERNPRGRPRGSGPGSRGGRTRKSMPSQVFVGTAADYTEGAWPGIPSQMSPEGYYNHPYMRGGLTGGRPSSSNGQAVSLGMHGLPVVVDGMAHSMDSYAHTKKTRTKPIRNSDGVLIRKDGRPDMRSQSSAANLRKVHARKEGERGSTPSSGLRYGVSMETESPSPASHSAQPENDNLSTEDRDHNDILSKMFPRGLNRSRKDQDYTRKVFKDGQDHTAQPRGHHLHSHSTSQHSAGNAQPRVKQEQHEGRFVQDSQSPEGDDDVNMEEREDDDNVEERVHDANHRDVNMEEHGDEEDAEDSVHEEDAEDSVHDQAASVRDEEQEQRSSKSPTVQQEDLSSKSPNEQEKRSSKSLDGNDASPTIQNQPTAAETADKEIGSENASASASDSGQETL